LAPLSLRSRPISTRCTTTQANFVTLSVSVALCTRNGERFVEAQLLSILDQTVLPAQIVVSDDASTDRTMGIVKSVVAEWRASHSEEALELIELHNEQPLGVTKNFEQAVLRTDGELIALSDQDDVWLPTRLERMVAEFDRRPDLLLLHSDAYLVDENGIRASETLLNALEVSQEMLTAIHQGSALTVLMRRNVVTGATTMFRRSLLDVAVPFADGWVHDEWLALTAATVGQMDILEYPLVEYRQHGANEIGAARLSFAGKARKVLGPGSERNERLLTRAESLAARIDSLSESQSLRDMVAEKLAHEVMRGALGYRRLSRVVPIVQELRTGRYGRFGRGPVDAVRDLVQPLRLHD